MLADIYKVATCSIAFSRTLLYDDNRFILNHLFFPNVAEYSKSKALEKEVSI